MDNEKKLLQTFKNVLNIEDEEVLKGIVYRDHGWDSVAHMLLVSNLEDVFDIMLDTDDVIDLSSFAKAKEILKKYGINF